MPQQRNRTRATFHVSPDVLEQVRNAAAVLARPPHHLTLGAIIEAAIRVQVERLQEEFNGGAPFPQRQGRLMGGRPVRNRQPQPTGTAASVREGQSP